MALKGHAYVRTPWAYQERPVASAKLNLWDDRIAAALEMAYVLINMTGGGADGVVAGLTAGDLEVTPAQPTGLTVVVQPGWAFISRMPYRLDEPFETAPVTPPVSQPRMDLVQARLADWDVTIKSGTESDTPSAPAADADCMPLAHVYLRPGMTSIRATDDAINGYLIDVRPLYPD